MVSRIAARRPVAPSRVAPEVTAAQFTAKGALKTKVPEASDVVALPGGRFLVVGDRRDTVAVLSPAARARR